MFKKVALYGLAFGSASAAMVLIQYINGLYRKPGSFVAAIPILANIILPLLGVFLFIKSISLMKTAKPINMGKALFGALLVCVLIAVCNIAAYQHVMSNRPDVVKDFQELQFTAIEKNVNADSSISMDKKAGKIEELKDNFIENTSTASFGRIQFMMCLSTGMVVALLTFLYNSPKRA